MRVLGIFVPPELMVGDLDTKGVVEDEKGKLAPDPGGNRTEKNRSGRFL